MIDKDKKVEHINDDSLDSVSGGANFRAMALEVNFTCLACKKFTECKYAYGLYKVLSNEELENLFPYTDSMECIHKNEIMDIIYKY